MNSKNKQRLTALSLLSVLFLGGCSNEKKYDHFELIENENNELVAMDDSYIDKDYIDNYYVVEVYNKMIKENEIYIAFKRTYSVARLVTEDMYIDIFTNLKIVDTENNEDDKEMFSFVKATYLHDYIVSFGLGQIRYSYDDMKNIYEVIKENYVFDKDNSLRKTRKFDNII